MTKEEAKYIALHAVTDQVRDEAARVYSGKIKNFRKSKISTKITKWELAELKKEYHRKASHGSSR